MITNDIAIKSDHKRMKKPKSPPGGNCKKRTERSIYSPWLVLQRGGYHIMTWPGGDTTPCPDGGGISHPGVPLDLNAGLPHLDPPGEGHDLAGIAPLRKGHRISGSIIGWRWGTSSQERAWGQWKYYGMEMGYPPSMLPDSRL